VSDRISTSKRIKGINNSDDTSQLPRKSMEYKMIKEIEPYHYYITGIIEQRKHIIIINTGQEENYIPRELVTEEEINSKEQICPELPKELSYTEETTQKEIIIGGIVILIKFKIYQSDNIILGIKWLEEMKPYNLENTQLIITYKNKKVTIKRTIWSNKIWRFIYLQK